MICKYKIITLCGSTRFEELYHKWNKKLTLDGNIVFSCGVFEVDCYFKWTWEKEKKKLDRIHKEKIRLSDAIFVINKDNYIGESTKSEIGYAKGLGKEIIYMEEINEG